MFRQKLILNWCYILAIAISFLELHAFAPIGTKWRVKLAHFSTKEDDDANNNNDEDPFFDLEELSRRIGNIESNEKKASDIFTEGLKQRTRELEMAEEVERSILSPTDESTSKHAQLIKLPCIVFDALLPKQRLKGNTEDPVFSRFLRDLGLGNLFVMLTVQPKYRKLRRNGMICSIEFVDAAKKENLNTDNKSETNSPGFYPDTSIPSAVDFIIVGRKPCCIVGPEKNLNARVGRWKRSYDPDGEEKVLGWGEEKFMDYTSSSPNQVDDGTADLVEVDDFSGLKPTEWSSNILERKFIEDLDEEFFNDQNQKTIIETLEFAQTLIPLIDHWIDLASNSETYENTDVTATARIKKGFPMLSINTDTLIRNVLQEIGETPPYLTECPEYLSSTLSNSTSIIKPFAFAYWGASLINPLPPLGVAPEIRGRILEVPSALDKLKVLEWGLKRSIENLEGTQRL